MISNLCELNQMMECVQHFPQVALPLLGIRFFWVINNIDFKDGRLWQESAPLRSGASNLWLKIHSAFLYSFRSSQIECGFVSTLSTGNSIPVFCEGTPGNAEGEQGAFGESTPMRGVDILNLLLSLPLNFPSMSFRFTPLTMFSWGMACINCWIVWSRDGRNDGKYTNGSQPWFPSWTRADAELLNEEKQNENTLRANSPRGFKWSSNRFVHFSSLLQIQHRKSCASWRPDWAACKPRVQHYYR